LKKTNKLKILIIGASGFIGENLYKFLKNKKFDVIGTYFNNKKKNLIKFDLEKDNISKIRGINYFSHIIISSGANKKLDDVEKNWRYEKKINYKNLKKVINMFSKKNKKIIYLSSDAVFDGIKGDYRETSKTNPVNKYGFHKKLMENYIKNKSRNFLIIRISKVFSSKKNDQTFLNEMLYNLKKKINYKYAYDEYFTPISINDLISGIYNLIIKDLKGIFHLKSINKISRYQLAKKIVKNLKYKNNIKKISFKSLDLFAKRGLNLDLNSNKYDNIFRKNKNNINYYINQIIKNYK